jgi:hypothetical protein
MYSYLKKLIVAEKWKNKESREAQCFLWRTGPNACTHWDLQTIYNFPVSWNDMHEKLEKICISELVTYKVGILEELWISMWLNELPQSFMPVTVSFVVLQVPSHQNNGSNLSISQHDIYIAQIPIIEPGPSELTWGHDSWTWISHGSQARIWG